MKSILLYASNDPAMESRLQAALDVARRCDAHLTLGRTQPYQDYLAIDMFGGAHLLADVLAASEAIQEEIKQKMEARLANESVKWDWYEGTQDTVGMLVGASRFADLIVFSLGDGENINRSVQRSVLGEIIVETQRPVLAVPTSAKDQKFERAMIAYDGGREASNAIRAALPLLQLADEVEIVEVEEKDSEFPLTDAADYLSRHGVSCQIRELDRGKSGIADTLLDHAAAFKPDYLVMGAYGHSRLRQTIFGGVTRQLLSESKIPLVMSS